MTHDEPQSRLRGGNIVKAMVAVVSLAIVVGVVIWDTQERTSPGPLHPSHKGVSELEGNDGCVQCHGEAGTSMDLACESCHEEIANQRDLSDGLHGALADSLAADCAECHVEHTGGAVELVTSRSFERAGAESVTKYAHSDIADFSLSGRHDALACIRCHVLAQTGALKAGEQRYLGLSQACRSCHEDIHQGEFGSSCASCHGQSESFDSVAEFEHMPEFALVGGHAKAACIDCHAPDSEHAASTLLNLPPERVRECAECHESPHRESFIASIAASEHVSETQSCAVCHDTLNLTFAYPDVAMERRHHGATGFPLDPPHEDVDCTACHTRPEQAEDAALRFATMYPGRDAGDCAACHEDPHRSQFNDGASGGRCTDCHTSTHFKPSDFGLAAHGQTEFPLTGAHTSVACAECHGADPQGFVHFASTQETCSACHEDVHNGSFDRRGVPAAVQGRSGCARCHSTEGFSSIQWTAADHLTWAGYALEGAHEAVSCTECHGGASTGRSSAARYTSASRDCATCHDDPHRGLFDREELPATLNENKGCARCHTPQSFSGIAWTSAEHFTWTGYALEGAHANVSCADCHRPSGDGRFADITAGVRQSDCAACHADPHLGQFVEKGRGDCSGCHQSLTTFSDMAFDHQRDSRFALDEFHSTLACTACHRTYALDDGTRFVRYKPLGTSCQDCHAFSSSPPGVDR